jgi:hypothetical protein
MSKDEATQVKEVSHDCIQCAAYDVTIDVESGKAIELFGKLRIGTSKLGPELLSRHVRHDGKTIIVFPEPQPFDIDLYDLGYMPKHAALVVKHLALHYITDIMQLSESSVKITVNKYRVTQRREVYADVEPDTQ